MNERTMRLVWDESLRQASEMLDWWKMQEGKGVRSTARNMSTLTLHVLARACFERSYSFQGSTDTLTEADPTNHRDALSLILENIVLILAFGPKFLARLSRPKRLARLGQATVTFKKYVTDLLKEEKDLMAQGKSERGNLMASLIRASDEEGVTTDPSRNPQVGSRAPPSRGGGGLTEDEIYGNMFVFSFAGHDTTAHTFTFAIYLLAAHPAVQEWLREELRYYLPRGAPSHWSYHETFPKLKRCLAVLVSVLLCSQSRGKLSSSGTACVPLRVWTKPWCVVGNPPSVPSHHWRFQNHRLATADNQIGWTDLAPSPEHACVPQPPRSPRSPTLLG